MIVQLKCFATLVSPDIWDFAKSTQYELSDGQTVENLILLSGINLDDVKIVFVNSRVAGFDTLLKDGDRVGLAPTVSSLKAPTSCINSVTHVNCGNW
jgi:molybdopterin converting factor small subunit